jgi:hypothetical protein
VATWPPILETLKEDLKIDDVFDDVALAACLAASVAFVERVKRGRYNFAALPVSPLPAPSDDLVLGTVRLAGRWYTRRRSPDGLLASTDFGSTRIPPFDADIERLLGIGRYSPMVIG